jgi:hypothetical protein
LSPSITASTTLKFLMWASCIYCGLHGICVLILALHNYTFYLISLSLYVTHGHGPSNTHNFP